MVRNLGIIEGADLNELAGHATEVLQDHQWGDLPI